ncbi:MAG: MBL fold metallo-hydrolase [Acidobacteria bacterium]|nr:MBL fold metallo-hydrolase [Acidobacteriota bacterium]
MGRSSRRLCILDVGHGNCAVLDAGTDEVVVFDAARGSSLLDFLLQEGLTRIRSVYLSHADEDHIAGLLSLIGSRKVTVDRVVANASALSKTEVWDDLAYELDSEHRAGRLEFNVELVAGRREVFDDVEIEVLAPSRYLAAKSAGSTDRSGRKLRTNSMSAVIRVSAGGRHVALLPGDLDEVGLDNWLAASPQCTEAAIVVFPHHGGGLRSGSVRAFARRFLAAVSPSVVVFSFGRKKGQNPKPEIVEMLREVSPAARVVCTQLSKHCADVLPSRGRIEHLSGIYARGRTEGVCCGGTVVVPLDRNEEIEPRRDLHMEFIRAEVATPLCVLGVT